MKLEVDHVFSPVKLTFEEEKEITKLDHILTFYVANTKDKTGNIANFAHILIDSLRNRVK